MRSRDKSIWMAILVGLVGLIIGFFIGEFFVNISQNVSALAFLRFLGHSTSFGLDTVSLNLIFAQITLGFTISLSVMGVLVTALFLFFYARH